jgi:thiosulfate/3-mercaptopyruvate sulfurtransferase
MPFTTLIDPATLAAHLGDPEFSIVDCSYNLEDEGWGRREYLARHIPGAVYAHLGRDLAGEKTGANGRHPLPNPATFMQTLGRLGVANNMQIVAYDQDSGMYASRLWWMLRWLGHNQVAVLDGGLARWLAEARPIAPGDEQRHARQFVGAPNMQMVAAVDEVRGLSGRSAPLLVDARAPERYRGEVEPLDKAAGHIPGAVNYFFKEGLNDQGTFRPVGELEQRLHAIIGGTPPEQIICYCGSGVSACHTLLAFELTGLRGAKLYPGSWSEWSSDPSRPIERSKK